MSDETPYIDPNSGAAPQPGGASTTALIEEVTQAEVVETGKVETEGTELIETEPGTDVGTDPNAAPDPEGDAADGDATTPLADADAGGVEDVEDDGTGEGDQDDDGSNPVEDFDPAAPGSYSVAQVLAYIAAHPDAKDAVVEAEKTSKNRKTIVES